MKKLRRLDVIRRLAFCMLLILPASLGAQTRPPIVEKIARTYGLDSWDKIEAIRFNFNAEGALKSCPTRPINAAASFSMGSIPLTNSKFPASTAGT